MAEEKKATKRKRLGLKNVRKSRKRRERNLAGKKSLKTAVKEARAAIAAKAADAADKLKKAISTLDKLALRRIIHPNRAARLKSRLTKSAAR